MAERNFADSVIDTFERGFPWSVVVKACDRFTLGIPDILVWLPMMGPGSVCYGIELKELSPLMEDPLHRGRRTGLMLKHPFTGPQISMLRKLQRAGVDAFGFVRAARDIAFYIHPDNLDPKTGNFTHEEMVKAGVPIQRRNGMWPFWERPNK